MSFYIYKHILNNEVVYVGKTTNMKNRQKQHSKDKFWFSDDLVIEYTEVTDSMIMDIYEKYYIDKHSPKYNIKDINCKYNKFFTNLEDLHFKTFSIADEVKIKTKITDIEVNDFSESFETYYNESLKTINRFKEEFENSGKVVGNLAYLKNYTECNFDIKNKILWSSKTKLYSSSHKNKTYTYTTFGTSLNLDNYSHLKNENQRNYKSLDELWNEIFTNCNWDDGELEEEDVEEWL